MASTERRHFEVFELKMLKLEPSS